MIITESYLPLDFFGVGPIPMIYAALSVIALLGAIVCSVIALRTKGNPTPFYIGIVVGVLATLALAMASASSYVGIAADNLAKNVATKYSNARLLEPEDVLWSFINSDGSSDEDKIKVVVIIGGDGHLYYLDSVDGGEEPLLLPVEYSESPDPKALLSLTA